MNPALTALVAVLALALSSAGGSFVVTAVLRAASRSTDAGHEHAEAAASADPSEVAGTRSESDGPEGARARAALRGGMWIGLLERIAVTGCVLIGAPSGVAVVVAVKGLGRYPELRENPGVSERFVIGSLASLLWAAFVGWVAISVLGS